ncbi:MAG: hypothetical protein HQK92_12445 [Nitrospirae bacterium]|nr:hypothetical protein [Nitrospirota bacterium]
MLAVHKLFVPLSGSDNPIYKDKAVVLIDKQNSKQQSKYCQFKKGHPYLFDNGQVFELDVETLEDYYPNGYKKSKDEIESKEKVKYAEGVANKITKDQFESEMRIIFNALEACNTKGFNPNK